MSAEAELKLVDLYKEGVTTKGPSSNSGAFELSGEYVFGNIRDGRILIEDVLRLDLYPGRFECFFDKENQIIVAGQIQDKSCEDT